VDVPEFKQRFRKPAGIVIGLVCQFVFLPLAGFASIRLFYRGDPVHGIPLLVTVCSPGGSYSNWWCSLFNSDLPLSMAMTSASSLFAVATLPINVLIYLKLSYPSEESAVTLDWGGLFTSLAVVVAGIVGGLILGRNKPAWRPRLNAAGNAAGVSLVLLGFFFSSNSSAPVWARADHFYAGVAMPCLFGLVISLAFAWACGLPKPQRLSVTIETCYQNTAIALAVILSSFSDDDA
jgi:sodium/bile acid cotransporter 2